MSCLPHDSRGSCGEQPAALVKPNSAAANSQSVPPFALPPCSRSACVTHQCKVSSQRNLKNAAVRDFVHHHDGVADDEAVAVACCNATSPRFCSLSESESGPPPRCQCLLCLLPWPQNACRWAKLPNLFHLRWKYNCGYVHVDSDDGDDDGDGDGDGGGSVRAFYCPFCSSCFCCCLFSFCFCWNFIIENVSMDVGSAKSAYLTPFADAVVFNLKGVLLLVTSASAFPIPPGYEWVKGFAVVS